MRFFEYTCDECGDRRRRITVHKLDGEELHFCCIDCLTEFAANADDDGALQYHITGQDITDGA